MRRQIITWDLTAGLVIGTTNGDEAMDECILKLKAENMKNEDLYNRIKTILID